MPKQWRLIDSGLVEPAQSAALDEAILESHALGEVPDTLHFYRRATPTVSVGYFQKAAESVDLGECERRGVAVIRRRSGGRSIYTDSGQLIYGLVAHEADFPKGHKDSFRVVCSAIARALTSLGVDAYFRPNNDVEVNGRKVSGSAQFISRGSVLIHGTVLVDTNVSNMDAILKVDRSKHLSMVKPSDRIVTLGSVLGAPPDIDVVKARLVTEFEATFGCRFLNAHLTRGEMDCVRRLVSDRYSRGDWNLRF